MLCFSRIFTGIGNGMVTSTIPTYQSECAKPKSRGFMIMNEGMLIGFGIMISYWIDYGLFFATGSVRWRFPVAFQAFFALVVIAGMLILPDSPRWLLKKNRVEQARDVIARLKNADPDSDEVDEEIAILEHTLSLEGQKFSYREFWRHGRVQHFRRCLLGVISQAMQQYCGINLITWVYKCCSDNFFWVSVHANWETQLVTTLPFSSKTRKWKKGFLCFGAALN